MRDSEVVASIVAADPGGLGAAYDRYADPLFKYCRTLLRDPADAANAVQDTFVLAASRLAGLRAPERLRSWLYCVARNESLRIVHARDGVSVLAQAPALADITGETGRADLRALFDDAIAGLTPGEREVIELQLGAGLAASEMADVLGVSPDHAHTLLSRAREQLETCLGILLVSRGGRDRCAELRSMLRGGDGRLTVPLRKRLGRHVKHCRRCTATRAHQLHRSLPGLSTGAALTTGAALSFRAAAGAPDGLRGHTLALAAGEGPAAAVHSAAVLSRAGEFTKAGFPKPAADATLAGRPGAARAVRHAVGGLKTGLGKTTLRPSPRGQAAVTAAGVVAVTAAVAAFSLTGHGQRFTPTADPKPPPAFSPPLSFVPPTTSASGRPRTTVFAPAKPAPATSKAAPAPASAPLGWTSAPAPAPPSTPPPAKKSPPPAKKPAPPAPSAPPTPAPPPPPTPTPAPTPTPTPTGTLSAFPAGGTLMVQPGGAAQITLTGSGGPVSWSVTVAGDPDGVVSVFPASGTLTPGSPSATVTVTVSQYLNCGGYGSSDGCPTITISPGGAVYSVWTGPGQHSHRRHHHGHSHDVHPASATAAVLNATAQLYLTETPRTVM
jgi:RNA polymerase sigma factor (sigma-70 family)